MNTIQLIQREGYTIIKMNHGKVNALNMEMVSEMRDAFKQLKADVGVKGVILTGQPHYFSAGLDLVALMQYNKTQIKDFFSAFASLFAEMMQFHKPLIAAISGHAPAGGCVLAVCCDNRYMALGDRYLIGLNEVAVNIQISQNLTEAYAYWMGTGLAHRYILEGKLLNGKEALNAGLVDELLPLEELLPRAEKQLQLYLKADQQILIQTKQKLKKHLLHKLDPDAGNALNEAAELWWKPEIRNKMEAYVKSFTNKKRD